jgi:GTPase SAR1 family protein
MAYKVLIMGLPGSGKTTLATSLIQHLKVVQPGLKIEWFNADLIRKQFDDWDFSRAGRLRQSERMASLASASVADLAICDFVAPLEAMRAIFAADCTIWLDTITESRFDDTNALFCPPKSYVFRVIERNTEAWVGLIGKYLIAAI